ncbi:MAG: hypothetical protein GXP01_01380 [Alphaproteobacteria bacterium]|nr:hypothetical protein [Alphaproteobacteria bacterium]
MMTSTHILIGAVVTTRPGQTRLQIAAGWFGGLFPDISMFVMVAVSRLPGVGPVNLWVKPDGWYWNEPWRTFDISINSIPAFIVILGLAVWLWRRGGRMAGYGFALFAFSVSALLHMTVDFLTHASDARPNFWPLSSWIFNSPVSYYEDAYFGAIMRPLDLILGLGLAVFLIWRFRSLIIRVPAVLLAAAPVGIWAIFLAGGHVI